MLRKLLDETPAWHRFDIVNDIIGGDAATVSFVAERFVDHQASTSRLSNLEWTLTCAFPLVGGQDRLINSCTVTKTTGGPRRGFFDGSPNCPITILGVMLMVVANFCSKLTLSITSLVYLVLSHSLDQRIRLQAPPPLFPDEFSPVDWKALSGVNYTEVRYDPVRLARIDLRGSLPRAQAASKGWASLETLEGSAKPRGPGRGQGNHIPMNQCLATS